MTSIRQPGVPSQSIQQAGARAAVQQTGQASGPPGPAAQLSPQEQLVQSAGLSGRASTVDLISGSPYNSQIRRLLDQQDFKSLERILLQANPQELAGLDLSLGDIEQIAQGLGHGSFGQSLPLIGSYRGDQKQVIAKLIQAAELHPNQKVGALNRLVDLDAVLSYVRSATPQELAALSNQHRHMALAVLDPGNSIWGTVSSAVTEAIDRRLLGNSREGDQIASRILRAAPNETELKRLVMSINSFNRDDVVYRYVMDLSPRELSALSDETRRLLLASLVDSSAFGVDFDRLGNLDEMFRMTFPEHAEAAQRLYQSMSAEAQGSAEVQALVQKSDALMQRIETLEKALRADLASGQLPREKMAAYAEQISAIQSEYKDHPEVQAKVTELLQLLQQAQQRLDQAARIASQAQAGLGQAETQIDAANTSLQQVEAQLGQYLNQLDQSQQALQQSAQGLEAQYAALASLYSQMAGPEAQSLLTEMQGLLQSAEPLPQKEARLQALNQQLLQLSQNLDLGGETLADLRTALDQTHSQLARQREAYQSAVTNFATQRHALEGQQHELGILLNAYQQQTGQLAQALSQAQQRWNALKDQPALQPADRQKLQQELQELQQAVSRHQNQHQSLQAQYDNTLLPQVAALDSATERVQLQADTAAAKAESVASHSSVVEHSFDLTQALWEQNKAAVSELMNKASELSSHFKARLSGAQSAADLESLSQQLTTELGSLRAELAAQHLSEHDIQSHLHSLQEVLHEVEQTRSLLQQTQGLQAQMSAAQTAFDQQASSLRQTIAAAQQEANNALENIQSEWQPRIAGVQAELERLESQLGNYASEASALQQALADNDAQKTQAKAAFAEALKNAQSQPVDIQALQQQLLERVAQLDSQRQALESALQGARQQMASVSHSMQVQRQTLTAYQGELAQESTQLNHLHAQINSQRQQLAELQARNQAQLQTNARLLDQQRDSLPPALSQALGDLAAQQQQLQGLVNQSQAILADHSAQARIERSSENLQNYVRLVQNELQQALGSLDSTAGQQQAVQTRINAIQNRLDNISQAAGLTQQSARQFLQTLENASQRGGLDPEALWAGAQEVLARAETAEDIAFALNEMNTLMSEIERRVQLAGQMISNIDTRTGQSEARLGEMETELTKTRETTRGMSRAISALQSEVNGHASALLNSQRELLGQRRSLGIPSREYQQALQQYDNLLSLGRPLTAQEQQQLQGLEGTLSGIESQLMRSAGELQHRLSSLNQVKGRVNAHLTNLRDSINRLSAMGRELQQMRPEAEDDLAALAEEHARFSQDREQLLTVIATVEQGPAAGTPRVQAQLRELRSRLASIETTLASLSQSMQRQERLLGRMQQTESAIQEEMQLAQLQIAQLELLFAKVDELIIEAGQQLQEVQALLGQVQTLRQEVSQVKARLTDTFSTESRSTAHTPPPKTNEQAPDTQQSLESRQALQKNSFSLQLTNKLSALWAGRRQSEAQRRESEHQQQREVFQNELEQRLALARQYDETLQVQLQQQESLEQNTAYLIQQIENGQRANSGVNLV